MRIGYVRISTKNQNTARQDELMEHLEVDKFYTDKVSGKNIDRPELQRMMDFVREGDWGKRKESDCRSQWYHYPLCPVA